MSKVTWEPWIDLKKDNEILPIDGPPCRHCDFWRPHRNYAGTKFDGITLCAKREISLGASGMEEDFSCFREKENSPETTVNKELSDDLGK